MTRHTTRVDDDDSDGSWSDDTIAFDPEPSSDDLGVVNCPYCGEKVVEDAPRCPSCGNYISVEDSYPERKSAWIVGTVLLCLFLVYCWMFGWPL